MKILITGGAGYIGSKLTEFFLDLNYQVTVIDNFFYKQNSLLHLCHHKKLKIVNGDARDKVLMEKVISLNDVIIPLACLTGAPACAKNPDYAKSLNLDAIQLITKLKSVNQILLFPTTNSGYGVGSLNKACDESSPLNPVSLYGKLKNQAEEVVLSTNNSMSFRLATIFGTSSRMRTDLLVNNFTYIALTEKRITLFESHFRRNFLYIGDLIKAFHFSIENFSKFNGGCFNLGNDSENMTKLQLALKIKTILPELNISENEFTKDPDQRDYIVSSEKLKNLGFEAMVSIEDGIHELIKAYEFLNIENARND